MLYIHIRWRLAVKHPYQMEIGCCYASISDGDCCNTSVSKGGWQLLGICTRMRLYILIRGRSTAVIRTYQMQTLWLYIRIRGRLLLYVHIRCRFGCCFTFMSISDVELAVVLHSCRRKIGCCYTSVSERGWLLLDIYVRGRLAVVKHHIRGSFLFIYIKERYFVVKHLCQWVIGCCRH
jgi:hypothetical protein